MTSSSPSVLHVAGLQKSFKKRRVVKDFSLDITSGEVVGLLGPNGAGKTTSFKMTVEQNIRAILEINLKDKAEIDRRLEKLLEDLNIGRLRASPAPALSGGERRRVEIARVLAMQPRFILLDEPFAGVDPIAVIDIQKIIAFLKERGIGVLITDHNVRETLRICDRAYIISEGTVLASGKPEELVADEQVRAVYLGENFDY